MRHLGGIVAAACALMLTATGARADGVGSAGRPEASTGAAPVAVRGGNASDPGILPQHAPSSAARPAIWRTYDMIVSLQNLPRTYTCDQLWYELHGILLRIGAWPYSINILPYHCSPSPRGYMKSPDVQVHFQLPYLLQGVAVKAAPAQAIERTIKLSPGEPKTLQASDCQLMQQISQTLLASIPARVGNEHFDCSGPGQRASRFDVTLTLPMAVRLPAVKVTAAAVPR
jgi:hypothetical protein